MKGLGFPNFGVVFFPFNFGVEFFFFGGEFFLWVGSRVWVSVSKLEGSGPPSGGAPGAGV